MSSIKDYSIDLCGRALERIKVMNPFVLALLIALAVLLIPTGENSLYDHLSYNKQIEEMTRERDDLKERIAVDRIKLEQLRYKKDELEKYAREEFLMKADDEDLYLIVD